METSVTPEAGGEEGETLAVGRLARAKTRQLLRVLAPDRRTSLVLVVLIFFVWLATGIYKVQPDEAGIIQRFGKFTYATGVGLHYHLPFPIETVLLPKVTKINQLQVGGRSLGDIGSRSSNQMLTGDENIVEADCTIFWRIKDATQYLFNVNDPDGTLRVAAESSVREVIARNPIQSALSDKRQQIAEDIRTTLQTHLDEYRVGISVTQVQLQRVEPPPAVIDAFNDVQRARSDQERARNEAEAYRNDILPRARGEAEKILREAEAYKAQVIDNAQGEAASFLALYKAYELAPDVTGWRLYLDAVDQMLRKASRVIVDSSGKGISSVLPVMSVDGRAVPGAAAIKAGVLGQPLPGGPKMGQPTSGQTTGQTGGIQP